LDRNAITPCAFHATVSTGKHGVIATNSIATSSLYASHTKAPGVLGTRFTERNLTDDHIVTPEAMTSSFIDLRQKALKMMFDGTGHMIEPIERWTELTRLNRLWSDAWTDYKEIDAHIFRARELAVLGRESVDVLKIRRDELRVRMSHCEADFEAELARLLGHPSWPGNWLVAPNVGVIA
jgi:hypothetical protein